MSSSGIFSGGTKRSSSEPSSVFSNSSSLLGSELELLLDGASLRTVSTDSFLIRAGDPAPAATIVLDGVAHVRRANTRSRHEGQR